MYEWIPESENEQHESNLNVTRVGEDPDQSLEEHKANFAQKASPGAFKYLLFSSICNLCCNLFICAFKFLGVD